MAEHLLKYKLTGLSRASGGSSQPGKPLTKRFRRSFFEPLRRRARVCATCRDAKPLAERQLRATSRHHVAKSGGLAVQGQSGGDRFVRSKDSRSANLFGASIGAEASPTRTGDSSVSSGSVLSVEHLSARQVSMSVLRRTFSCFGANVRSRRAGLAGRPQSLGEHRHLLHRMQPQEGRGDSTRSRIDLGETTEAADVSSRARDHLWHGGSTEKLARLLVLGWLTSPRRTRAAADEDPEFQSKR